MMATIAQPREVAPFRLAGGGAEEQECDEFFDVAEVGHQRTGEAIDAL